MPSKPSAPKIGIAYLEPLAADLTSAHSVVLEVAALARRLPASVVLVAVEPKLASGRFRLELPGDASPVIVRPAWRSGWDLYGPSLARHYRRINDAMAQVAEVADTVLIFDADAPSIIAAAAARRLRMRLAVYLRGERGYDRTVRHAGGLARATESVLELGLRLATRRWMDGAAVLETAPGLAGRVGVRGPTMAWSPTYLEHLPPSPIRSPEGPLRVLSVGRISAEKRVDDMVTAVELVTERGVDVRFTIVGDGPLMGPLRSRVAESAAADHIVVTGFIPPGPELDAKYHEASVFMILSETEGRPKTVVEAMSWAVPVIWTPVGGLPGIFDSTGQDLRVPVGDPAAVASILERLAREPTDLEAASREARNNAARFLLDGQVSEALAFLRRSGSPK